MNVSCRMATFLALLIAIVFSACVGRLSADQVNGFRAGAAQRNVTPPVGIEIVHYPRESIGIHDPIFVRAIVLLDGQGHSLAIVCADFVGMGFDACDQLQAEIREKFGIEETVINSSHSHSSVGLGPRRPKAAESDPHVKWNNETYQKLLDCVAEAKSKVEPVTLRVGRAKAQVGYNRRIVSKTGLVLMGVNKDGPVVPWVNVLIADSKATKKPVAVLFQHSAHPVIVPHTSQLTSADFPGAAVKRVREELGEDVIALFGQGCAGNINGFPLRTTHQHADNAGKRLGDAVLKAMKTSVPLKSKTFTVKSARTTLPSKAPPTLEEWQAWQKTAEGNAERTAQLQRLKGLIDRGENPPPRRFDAYAVMIGREWCLVTMPHEMFCQYELWIDKRAPFEHTMTFAYTNGGQGYVAVDLHWALGAKGGYEAGSLPLWWSSGAMSEFFGPPAIGSEKIIKDTIASLWPAESK